MYETNSGWIWSPNASIQVQPKINSTNTFQLNPIPTHETSGRTQLIWIGLNLFK